MRHRNSIRRAAWTICILLGAADLPLRAQLPVLTSLRGEIVTGVFFDRYGSRGGFFEDLEIPVGLNANLSGYAGHPDFLSFRLSPQFALGNQPLGSQIELGDGFDFSATILRKRFLPVTLSYSNQDRGFEFRRRLSGSPGATQFFQGSRTSNFRLGTVFDVPGLPRIQFTHNRFSTKSRRTGGDSAFLRSGNRSQHTRWDISQEIRSWALQGNLTRTRVSAVSGLLNGASLPPTLGAKNDSAYANANSLFSDRIRIQAGAGWRRGRSSIESVGEHEFTDTFSFGRVRFGGNSKLSSTFNVRMDRQELGNPLASVFVNPPTTQGLSSAEFGGGLSYRFDFGLRARGGTSYVRGRPLGVSSDLTPAYDARRMSAGLDFQRRFLGLRLSTAADFDRRFSQDSFRGTRRSGRLQLAGGSPQTLDWTMQFTMSDSSSDIGNPLTGFRPMETLSRDVALSLNRKLGGFLVGVSGGLSSGRTLISGKSGSRAWQTTVTVTHTRFSATYHRGLSRATPLSLSFGDAAGVQLPLIPELQPDVTFRSQSASLSTTPLPRLRLRASWNQGQGLFGDLSNARNEMFFAGASYSFRLIRMEAGYENRRQVQLGNSLFRRRNFFVRVVRTFVIF